MRLLRAVLIALATIIVLAGAAFVAGGLLLPSQRTYVNEVVIDAPAETIWHVLTDRERYTEWQSAITRVEVVDDKTWIEYPKNSPEPLRFKLAKDERPVRMAFEYTMGEFMTGRWSGEINQVGNSVTLRTEDSYSANGWLSKILMAMFFNLDGFAEDWNQQLKRRAESIAGQ
jgi:uncharacterized membrane protein